MDREGELAIGNRLTEEGSFPFKTFKIVYPLNQNERAGDLEVELERKSRHTFYQPELMTLSFMR